MTDRSTGNPGLPMHELLRELFPICRSLTGDGVRATLRILARHMPLDVHEVPTGTQAFDWTVPLEWNAVDAYVQDSHGQRVIDFHRNNLHLVGYSKPVDRLMTRAELEPHLHSRPDLPTAIPYVTAYYADTWGFCLAHEDRMRLGDGPFRVVINTSLQPGSLTYADLVVPGLTDQEVLLSTYVCHPSMANNELSGPVVATYLYKWVRSAPRRYTYRFVFIPETIGALVYLSRHLDLLRAKTVAGYVLTCLGDDRSTSFVPSRDGDTLADRAALAVLEATRPGFIRYTYLDRGSDERQYCSPGVDLPVASVMRSKYGTFPEYHTSLDNPQFVTPDGLRGGFEAVRDCLELIERNGRYRTRSLGEPQLGRRGLYPKRERPGAERSVADLLNVLAYADGEHDVIAMVRLLGITPSRVFEVVDQLVAAELLDRLDP